MSNQPGKPCKKNYIQSPDYETAAAFACSWNHLFSGSAYTYGQFLDWIAPISPEDITGKTVLELGCGNASLMVHMITCNPSYIEGVDLGDAVISARNNMSLTGRENWNIHQEDMTTYREEGFDVVYCIGVLHHLRYPKKGLDSVIANVKKGGRFHCWVYAREGNALVIHFIDPIRKITSRLPWWITKYCIATPLAVPFFIYAKLIKLFDTLCSKTRFSRIIPLYKYCIWIAKREFSFFRHVAFDQLVTPQTVYIPRETIQSWLDGYDCIDKETTYIIMRNGNSWKFGGIIK